MNRDDIIRMAREAGARPSAHPEKWDVWQFQDPAIERFAALVAAAEREAMLDLVDDYAKGNTDLKAAIRARGEKK